MALTKVLVVEDEGIVALDLQHQLIDLGYAVPAVAATGEDALLLVAETTPDIVLMDIRLAGKIDGITAAKRIRTEFATPVIFLTAHADATTLDRAKQSQPFAYLLKPFVTSELRPTIEIALAHHQIQRQERVYTQRLEAEIEERKRVEAALRASEHKLRGIIDQSVDGIVLLDGEGCIVEWNQGMESITGVRSADALGRPVLTLLPDDVAGRQLLDELMRTDMQTDCPTARMSGANQTFECVLSHPDAAQRMVEYKTFKVVAQGNTLIGAVVRDITERKYNEQQALSLALEKERVRLLTDFITDASHAFRTPLSVIGTRAFLLIKAADENKKSEHLSVINQEIQFLIQLLENLVVLAKLDSGVGLDLKLLDLNLLFQPLLVWGHEEASARKIFLTAELADNLPLVQGDSRRLLLAFRHILDNAFRYTPPGGKVFVRTWIEPLSIGVEIQDTGIGMTEAEYKRAFERFYRGDEARSARGLGLGLAITKQILDLHQWPLQLTSELGRGSVFRVQVPVAYAPEQS